MSSSIQMAHQEFQTTSLLLDQLLSCPRQEVDTNKELISELYKKVTELYTRTQDIANKDLDHLNLSTSDPCEIIMATTGITHDVENSFKQLEERVQRLFSETIPAAPSSVSLPPKAPESIADRSISDLCRDVKHRIDTLSCRLRSIDGDVKNIEGYFLDTLDLFESAALKIQADMTKCSYGQSIKPEKEEEFFALTNYLDTMKCDFKNLCHTMRTYHPTFSFPTTDIVAQSPRLLMNEQPSERANILRYSQKNQIDLSSYLCRPILGDGNCFYHSIATSIIDEGRLDEFISIIPDDLHLPPLLRDQLDIFFQQAKENPENAISNTNGMMKFVWALKEITARELFIHAADYSLDELRMYLIDEFPQEEATINLMGKEALIQAYVREMGKEACAITIGAFSRATKLPIIIHNPSRVETPMNMVAQEARGAPIHIFRAGLHFFLLQAPRLGRIENAKLTSAQITTLTVLSHTPGQLFVRGAKGFAELETKESPPTRRETLSWDRGIPLKQTSSHTWQIPLSLGSEYKLLIDDKIWSDGENKIASSETQASPVFPLFRSSSSILVNTQVGFGNRIVICGEGTIALDGTARKLSWNPAEGLPLTCLEPSIWAAQFTVAAPGHFKIVMLQADGTAKWEKGENRLLKDPTESSITPHFEA